MVPFISYRWGSVNVEFGLEFEEKLTRELSYEELKQRVYDRINEFPKASLDVEPATLNITIQNEGNTMQLLFFIKMIHYQCTMHW